MTAAHSEVENPGRTRTPTVSDIRLPRSFLHPLPGSASAASASWHFSGTSETFLSQVLCLLLPLPGKLFSWTVARSLPMAFVSEAFQTSPHVKGQLSFLPRSPSSTVSSSLHFPSPNTLHSFPFALFQCQPLKSRGSVQLTHCCFLRS